MKGRTGVPGRMINNRIADISNPDKTIRYPKRKKHYIMTSLGLMTKQEMADKMGISLTTFHKMSAIEGPVPTFERWLMDHKTD